MQNPFFEGEHRILRPPPCALVIFGATGDLTARKLIPALYELHEGRLLPAGFVVVGAARSELSDEEFRERIKAGLQRHARGGLRAAVWEEFSRNIFYQRLDGQVAKDFAGLKARLEALGAERAQRFNYLYYLAVSPAFYAGIAANLKLAGLAEPPGRGARATFLLVEKPFGTDLESAVKLNRELSRSFHERQIFRIDHYLGKETVQNILVFRFANGIFEPIWNRNYVESIQISMAEDIGVGSRAPYFDQTGILRDIVQNHLLQILALLCIEPPISLSDPDGIRDEKVKVLRSIRRWDEAAVRRQSVRGQYAPGFVFGEAVPGYLEEPGVSAGSRTETYAALRLEIDNWRWSGVPIFIRAGKRLPKRITEVAVSFRRPPAAVFRGRQVGEIESNVLAIQVQPDEGISLRVNSKPPGPRLRVRPVDMDFRYGSSFGSVSADAYERLLLDAMSGDPSLFTRDDEIEQAWDFLGPVLEGWVADAAPLHPYEAGTWGPSQAGALLDAGLHWRAL